MLMNNKNEARNTLIKARQEIAKMPCKCIEVGRICNRCQAYNNVVMAIVALENM